ncbi:TBCC domain-containing protein 1 [Vitis vinifera]|uniref:TBCC domain-containing protein 1 n=1 Tax=Vitis vinifera TaxID=29760 RepID=A0A438HAK3_VITVI|nr:TBCC domain-containing protein 1 [Vitis vinifera]
MERFEHLGFLIQFGEKGSEGVTLSQAAPFFANSDPDMPAVPVPAAQVHDWDVAMADACASSMKSPKSARGPSFIEGISKSSYVKQAPDLKGSSLKVLNCHDSVIYILAPLRFATIYGCSDATIVLGAVGKAVRVEHCERVHVIAAAKRICIANCRECVFFLGVNQQPLIVGDNHKLQVSVAIYVSDRVRHGASHKLKGINVCPNPLLKHSNHILLILDGVFPNFLQVAPYNTFYSQLEEHMNQVGIEPTVNKWDELLALGVVDPHDSLSHPAGVSDIQAESATRLDPDQFTNFLIPNWFGGESAGTTKDNPFPLPDAYMASQQRNHKNLGEIKQILRETPLEENRKRELSCALHVFFKDWLYGNDRFFIICCLTYMLIYVLAAGNLICFFC